MKHSKLPWFISKCALHQGHYDIISPTRLVTCVKGDNKKDAAFIVTACNEYDTLKARAELFDEAIELLDKANRRVIADNQSVPDRHYPFEVTVPAGELLSKARELK